MLSTFSKKGASALTISIFYAGLFIGAGFTSGQELWQYFGKYKILGVIFLILGSFLQGFLGYFIVKIVRKSGAYSLDILPCKKGKTLNAIFTIMQVVFMVFTVSVMIAGISALYSSLIGKNGLWFSMLFTIIIGVTARFGIDGVVNIFKVAISLLLAVSIALFIIAISKNSVQNYSVNYSVKTVFGALNAAIIYYFHNVYLALPLLIPYSKKMTNKKSSLCGFLLSSVIFLALGLFILTPLILNPNYVNFPLPLLEFSKSINPFIFYFFALCLGVVMFSCSLSSAVATVDYLQNKNFCFIKNKALLTVVVLAVCFILSQIGFKSLIALFYPVCGYLGIIFIICLVFGFNKRKIE